MSNPIKYSDLIQPDDAINSLIAQLKELDETYAKSAKDIREEAARLSKELKNASGATEEGRKATRAAATDADRLAAAQEKLTRAQSENAMELEEVNQAIREAQRLTKLNTKLNNAAEGSYDKLSAQYSLNKMRLNAMSKAARETTKEGILLESQTKDLYEEMKRLQAATGQYQLNVGNYASGFSAIGFQVQQLARELPTLAVGLPQFFLALSNNIPMLTDAIANERKQIALAKKENRGFVSVGKQLVQSIFSWQTALVVAISAFTIYGKEIGNWIKQLFKGKDAMDDFRQSISGMVGSVAQERAELGALFNALSKAEEGTANYVAVRNTILDKYGDLLKNEREEVRNLNNIAEAYDLIQKKISGKAIVEGFTEQVEKQSEKFGEAYKDYYDDLLDTFTNAYGEAGGEKLIEYLNAIIQKDEEAIKSLTRPFEVSRIVNVTKNVAGKIITKQELQNWNTLEKTTAKITEKFAKISEEMNASIQAQQQAMEMYSAVAPDVEKGGGAGGADDEYNRAKRSLEIQQTIEKESLKSQEQYQYDSNLSAQENETLRLKQEFEMRQRHKEQMLQLEERYSKISAEDARKTRELYAQEEATFENNLLVEEAKITEQIYKNNLNARRAREDAELALQKESWDKRRKQITSQYSREIEDLQYRLDTEKTLTENERNDINATILALGKKQSEEIAQSIIDEAEELLNLQYEVSLSDIDLLENTEEEKTRLRLQAEKDRWEKVLKINRDMSDTERKIINNNIALLDKQIAETYKNNDRDIYDVLGFDLKDEQKNAINTTMSYVNDALNEWANARVRASQLNVDKYTEDVEAAERAVELEKQARANGYASDVQAAEKELALAKKTQAKAIEEQKRAQREQVAINALQQTSDLITASAKIWADLGFPSALAALGVMWGSFAYSKIKAAQVASESYGEGTVELLQGGSHASGRDIDLGTKPDGTRRRAEGGEFFAVINKRNSRRYRNVIPDLINSINDGTLERYLSAFNGSNLNVAISGNNDDLKGLGKDVRAIREQGERREVADGKGRIIYYKNVKRRVC